jgi:hypothetical protein
VIRDYHWTGGPDELFSFYGSHLEQLGWQSLVRQRVPSAGGDFEELTGTRDVNGYTVTVSVRTVKFGRQDFDVS